MKVDNECGVFNVCEKCGVFFVWRENGWNFYAKRQKKEKVFQTNLFMCDGKKNIW